MSLPQVAFRHLKPGPLEQYRAHVPWLAGGARGLGGAQVRGVLPAWTEDRSSAEQLWGSSDRVAMNRGCHVRALRVTQT